MIQRRLNTISTAYIIIMCFVRSTSDRERSTRTSFTRRPTIINNSCWSRHTNVNGTREVNALVEMKVLHGAMRCHNGAKMVPQPAYGCHKVPSWYEGCQYVDWYSSLCIAARCSKYSAQVYEVVDYLWNIWYSCECCLTLFFMGAGFDGTATSFIPAPAPASTPPGMPGTHPYCYDLLATGSPCANRRQTG